MSKTKNKEKNDTLLCKNAQNVEGYADTHHGNFFSAAEINFAERSSYIVLAVYLVTYAIQTMVLRCQP
jgi:hypothetical protein